MDCFEIFSLVARLDSTWALISLAMSYNWPLFWLDVRNVLFHGYLQEEVYMEQPPKYAAQEESDRMCKLRKTIYGLK